ncbi:MAG TPA: pyridoxine 5'-phosphate synthase [archaeon]|nr:pyridoxine 5'-phosphate synthase [archaeon]
MGRLFIKLDSVAMLRQTGETEEPDPVLAAAFAELAGASGVSIAVGRERDNTQERDVRLLKETVRTVLNVTLPPQEEWVKLVLAIRPDVATLAPPRREGAGAELVLDVEDRQSELQPMIAMLKSSGIVVSVLVDPASAQVKAAQRVGAAMVLLHTGRFCWAEEGPAKKAELERLVNAAKMAGKLGLSVHVGGGLGYRTVSQLAAVREIEAIHIGHSVIARAVLVGMGEAVRELLRILTEAEGWE